MPIHDDDAVSERVTLTHTAVVGSRDEVPLANSSVTVRVIDPDTQRGDGIPDGQSSLVRVPSLMRMLHLPVSTRWACSLDPQAR